MITTISLVSCRVGEVGLRLKRKLKKEIYKSLENLLEFNNISSKEYKKEFLHKVREIVNVYNEKLFEYSKIDVYKS